MVHNKKKIEYRVTNTGCYECTSHKTCNHGYPRMKRDGKNVAIYRYIFIEHHGEVPKGYIIRHKCDNTLCINIHHLELGTHSDNMRDMVERQRSLTGEKNHKSVLTEDNVKSIRDDKVTSNKALAKVYGVTFQTISAIRLRKTWKHIS